MVIYLFTKSNSIRNPRKAPHLRSGACRLTPLHEQNLNLNLDLTWSWRTLIRRGPNRLARLRSKTLHNSAILVPISTYPDPSTIAPNGRWPTSHARLVPLLDNSTSPYQSLRLGECILVRLFGTRSTIDDRKRSIRCIPPSKFAQTLHNACMHPQPGNMDSQPLKLSIGLVQPSLIVGGRCGVRYRTNGQKRDFGICTTRRSSNTCNLTWTKCMHSKPPNMDS